MAKKVLGLGDVDWEAFPRYCRRIIRSAYEELEVNYALDELDTGPEEFLGVIVTLASGGSRYRGAVLARDLRESAPGHSQRYANALITAGLQIQEVARVLATSGKGEDDDVALEDPVSIACASGP
jgi:hypothetical protein